MWSSPDSGSRKKNPSLEGRNGKITFHRGIYTGGEEFVDGVLGWVFLVCLFLLGFSFLLFFLPPTPQSLFVLGRISYKKYIVVAMRMSLEDLPPQEYN